MTTKQWSKRDKEDKIKQLTDRMNEAIKNYQTDPKDEMEWLRSLARFKNYSAKNTLLVKSQYKGEYGIASYKDFQKSGYQLQKGEKSLSILAPSMQKLVKDEKGISKLLNYAGEQGLHIKVGKTDSAAKGYYVPSTNNIVLKDTLDSKEKVKVLLHEMAHAEMHHSSKLATKT